MADKAGLREEMGVLIVKCGVTVSILLLLSSKARLSKGSSLSRSDQMLFNGKPNGVCSVGCAEPIARTFDIEAHGALGDP